jgi:hypothetical protein
MTQLDHPKAGMRLHDALDASFSARARAQDNELVTQIGTLEQWQKRRLANTYRDLVASKRHRAATEFFTTDLYAPADLDQRDDDVRRMYPMMLRLLPESAIDTVATAIELQALTLELDLELVRAKNAENDADSDWTEPIYACAYRRCDNFESRERQIGLIIQVGKDLDHLVCNPLIRGALRVARGPAALAGISTLQRFLERGFAAFRAMRGADHFLRTIETRERAVLEAIFSGSNHPFDV